MPHEGLGKLMGVERESARLDGAATPLGSFAHGRIHMKKLVLVTLAILLAGGFALAEGIASPGQFGLQTAVTLTNAGLSPSFDVGAKYILTTNIALRAALGLLSSSSAGSSTTYFDLGAGFEYHFGGTGGVSPYAGAEISYSTTSAPGGNGQSQFGLAGVFGGEYFFSSNFSWAGETRLGVLLDHSAGVNTTILGTIGFATFLTWFIN